MRHKEEHEELAYYKAIAAEISKYEEVLLFGPTDAKTELLNLLKENHLFDKMDIETRQADKMTENQQHAFVKEYFFKLDKKCNGKVRAWATDLKETK